jgi:hypothetical protein
MIYFPILLTHAVKAGLGAWNTTVRGSTPGPAARVIPGPAAKYCVPAARRQEDGRSGPNSPEGDGPLCPHPTGLRQGAGKGEANGKALLPASRYLAPEAVAEAV